MFLKFARLRGLCNKWREGLQLKNSMKIRGEFTIINDYRNLMKNSDQKSGLSKERISHERKKTVYYNTYSHIGR